MFVNKSIINIYTLVRLESFSSLKSYFGMIYSRLETANYDARGQNLNYYRATNYLHPIHFKPHKRISIVMC